MEELTLEQTLGISGGKHHHKDPLKKLLRILTKDNTAISINIAEIGGNGSIEQIATSAAGTVSLD